MWRAFYLVFSLSSSQWVYLVDRTFSHYKQIQPPANKRCTDGKRAQHKYHRGDQVGIRLGYSASNVGNAEGRCGGGRVDKGRTEGGQDKKRGGQREEQTKSRAGRTGEGDGRQDKELTRAERTEGRQEAGARDEHEKRMPRPSARTGQVQKARNGREERTGNLSVK